MRTTTARALTALAVAGTLALTATACGGGTSTGQTSADAQTAKAAASPSRPADPFAGQTAAQIANDAKNAMLAADSVELKGTMAQDGKSLTLDITVARSGGCKGTISLGTKGKMSIVLIGKTVWLKVDQAFLDANGAGAAAPELLGKYLKTTTSDKDTAAFDSFCDMKTFADSAADSYTKGALTEVDGQQALTLVDTGDKSSVLVSAATPHRIIRLVAPTAAEGALTVSYNAISKITPPPAGEVVDAAKLGM